MKKKNKLPPITDADENFWLLSYADMMTLLTCFFILMMGASNFDEESFTEKTKDIAKFFNQEKFMVEVGKLEKLKMGIEQDESLSKMAKAELVKDHLEITFEGHYLFDSGRATLRSEIRPKMDEMVKLIKTTDPDYRITVEGHTDHKPLIDTRLFTSNWALSGARAATVLERFENYGFIPTYMRAIGFGSTRPEVDIKGTPDENNPKMLNKNRRVVIKVYKPISDKQFGIYINTGERKSKIKTNDANK